MQLVIMEQDYSRGHIDQNQSGSTRPNSTHRIAASFSMGIMWVRGRGGTPALIVCGSRGRGRVSSMLPLAGVCGREIASA